MTWPSHDPGPFSAACQGRRRSSIDYGRIADAAERLARTEEEAAATFEHLAGLGGIRAGHRRAFALEAQQQRERLLRWAGELRDRGAAFGDVSG